MDHTRIHRREFAPKLGERLVTIGESGNCLKRRVGAAILSPDGEVLVAAANGTPAGMARCDNGGCVRCAAAGRFVHGLGYDMCICLHAEQAVLISAISKGLNVRGCIMATSYQPCIMCAKLVVGAKFEGVIYAEPWHVPEVEADLPGLRAEYERLWRELPFGCQPLAGCHVFGSGDAQGG